MGCIWSRYLVRWHHHYLGGVIDLPTAIGQITAGTLGTCAALWPATCERTLPNKMGGLITDQNGITKSTAFHG